MKAWWTYWLTLAVGAVLWIGVAIVGGREGIRTALGQPIWAAILLAPIFLAGLNLVAFRQRTRSFAGWRRSAIAGYHLWSGGLVGSDVRADRDRPPGIGVALVVWVVTDTR